jgi:hypothetical protein
MLPNNNKDTFTIVIVVILFFIFFMPKIEKKHDIEEYNLESDINNKFKYIEKMSNVKYEDFHNKECSKPCCRHIQWLPEHMKFYQGEKFKKYEKFAESSHTCRGGCICETPNMKGLVNGRGGSDKEKCKK